MLYLQLSLVCYEFFYQVLREQLTQDLDNFATRVSSLCIKKKAAEKRYKKTIECFVVT